MAKAQRVSCLNCGKGGHPTWQCPKPPKASTAAQKDVRTPDRQQSGTSPTRVLRALPKKLPAGTQAPPVDTTRAPAPSSDCKSDALPKEGLAATGSSPGAPTKFDKVAYQRKYMREVYRPKRKASKHSEQVTE